MPQVQAPVRPPRAGPDPLVLALAAPVSVLLGFAAVLAFLAAGLAAAAIAGHVLDVAG